MLQTPAGRPINLSADRYEVAVTMRMTDRELMRLPEYQDARRKLEDASVGEDERIKVLEEYFLPDRAKRIALEMLSDYSQVVVRYYEVEVVSQSWTPETALFLPRHLGLAKLMDHLPKEKVFGFDAAEVRTELDFRNVPEGDQPFIIDALSRVGMIPYRLQDRVVRRKSKTPTPRYRLFHVSVVDGRVSSPMLN